MDAGFWKKPGHLKVQRRISLADAFDVTLAERELAILVTSDQHEFDPLLATGSYPFYQVGADSATTLAAQKNERIFLEFASWK